MTTKPRSLRTSQLTLIHVGRQELGMDDGTYRDMLWTLGRVRSAKDLDEAGRRQVIDHLRARGFKPRKKNYQKRNPIKRRTAKLYDPLEKIQALLVVLNAGWEYADGIARRMYQIESVAFLNSEQATAVIAALTVKAQKLMRSNLNSLLSLRQMSWGECHKMAVGLGYRGNKLESNVEYMCRVWEKLQGSPYGNNPAEWTRTRPQRTEGNE